LARSPILRPDLSAVADIDGRIVGVLLTGISRGRIAEDLPVRCPVSLIIVDPDYRRRGIGSRLVGWGRRNNLNGGEVRFGVSSEETRRNFWSKITTSVGIPDNSLTYTKEVSLAPIERAAEKVSRLSGTGPENDSANDARLVIRVEIAGLPSHILLVGPSRIRVKEGNVDMKPEISLVGETDSLKLSSLSISILTRRLEISGVIHFWKLLSCRRILMSFARELSAPGSSDLTGQHS
jgi:hypothetical protein